MKWFGAGLIVFCSGGIGIGLVLAKQKRLQCLRDMCAALCLLEGELTTNLAPLPELFRWVARHSERSARRFFGMLEKSMERLGEQSMSALWETACQTCLGDLSVPQREDVAAVGAPLGHFEINQQLQALRRCQTILASYGEAELAAFRSEKRTLLLLPGTAGVLLALFLF